MSELGGLIREMILREGPIPLERYMGLALGHPSHGYYMTRDPLGAGGDFVTAPEISQMFGELIGLWCADYWGRMGGPRRINLVELGPGRGTLMRDALRAARVSPRFFAALEPTLVEISPVLRAAQRATLAQSGAQIAWRERFDEVPDGPLIVIANEFFDALPVRHYVKSRGGWRERVVGLAPDGRLKFGVSLQFERALRVEATEGSIIEINAIGQRLMAAIAERLAKHGGAALLIDYGHAETCLGETLQAVRVHAYADPLEEPGEADMTAHVDFAALARAAKASGAVAYGPLTQGELLTRLGILNRARALARDASPAQAAAIEAALKRLTSDHGQEGQRGTGGMGGLFKALAVGQTGAPVPAAFEEGARAP